MGQGAFGSVYISKIYKVPDNLGILSYWKKLKGKEVAVKTIHGRPDIFKSERNILECIPKNSRGLMRYYGSAGDEMNGHLIMELGPYGCLLQNKARLNQGDLSSKTNRYRSLLSDCLSGLATFHNAGLVHQDITPKNIVIRSINPWSCFIVDFGATYKRTDAAPVDLKTTCRYVAPEQLKREYGNPLSDIWSLVVSFLLCSLDDNDNPFKDITHESCILKMIENGKLLKELITGSFLLDSKSGEDLILGMLEPDTKLRFSAEEAYTHPFIQGRPFTTNLRKRAQLKRSQTEPTVIQRTRQTSLNVSNVAPLVNFQPAQSKDLNTKVPTSPNSKKTLETQLRKPALRNVESLQKKSIVNLDKVSTNSSRNHVESLQNSERRRSVSSLRRNSKPTLLPKER